MSRDNPGGFAPLASSLGVAAKAARAQTTRGLVSQASKERVERSLREQAGEERDALDQAIRRYGSDVAALFAPTPVLVAAAADPRVPEAQRNTLAQTLVDRGQSAPSSAPTGVAGVVGLYQRADQLFDQLSNNLQHAIQSGDTERAKALLGRADQLSQEVRLAGSQNGAAAPLVQHVERLREELYRDAVQGGVSPRVPEPGAGPGPR